MKEYDKKELLSALNYIQSVCQNFDLCDNCPLNTNDGCMTTHGAPVDWNLKKPEDEQVWRAYKQRKGAV